MCKHCTIWGKHLDSSKSVLDVEFSKNGFKVVLYTDEKISEKDVQKRTKAYKSDPFFKEFRGGIRSVDIRSLVNSKEVTPSFTHATWCFMANVLSKKYVECGMSAKEVATQLDNCAQFNNPHANKVF